MLNRAFMHQVGYGQWFARTALRQIAKRSGRTQTIRLPTGAMMTLPPDSRFASEIFITRSRVDHGAEELFASMLHGDRDVLDVGANIGYYSVYVAPRARRVFAFEPDRRNLPALKINAEQSGNVSVVAMAVSDTPGMVALDTSGSPELSRIVDSAGTGQVEATTIDVFVENRDLEIDAVKIDVEGHDFAVLRGAKRTITAFAPLILTECEPHYELLTFCKRYGYDVWACAHPPGKPWLACLTKLPAPALQTKMLFLVPARLRERFVALASSVRPQGCG